VGGLGNLGDFGSKQCIGYPVRDSPVDAYEGGQDDVPGTEVMNRVLNIQMAKRRWERIQIR
jgi:hypothetical protein